MSFSENFIAIMNELGKKIGVAIDWTATNVTPYITDLSHRLIKYEIASSIINIVCFIVLFIICYIGIRKFSSVVEKKLDTEFAIVFTVILSIIMLVSPVGIIIESKHIVESIYLPEKVILDLMKEAADN